MREQKKTHHFVNFTLFRLSVSKIIWNFAGRIHFVIRLFNQRFFAWQVFRSESVRWESAIASHWINMQTELTAGSLGIAINGKNMRFDMRKCMFSLRTPKTNKANLIGDDGNWPSTMHINALLSSLLHGFYFLFHLFRLMQTKERPREVVKMSHWRQPLTLNRTCASLAKGIRRFSDYIEGDTQIRFPHCCKSFLIEAFNVARWFCRAYTYVRRQYHSHKVLAVYWHRFSHLFCVNSAHFHAVGGC